MSKKTVDLMIEGGKATSGAQMGQSFGPLGVDISMIINEINKKTAEFKGMKLPVKVIVETDDKSFELEIGTPPVSELIKKELGLQKGSSEPNLNKVGNLAIEQVIKIAKMKQNSMLVNNLKSAVKTVIGSCGVSGVLVESKEPKEINEEISKGVYDEVIEAETVEVSEEKKRKLKEGLDKIKGELEREKAEKKAEESEEEKAEGKAEEGEKKEEVKGEKKEEGKGKSK